VKTSHPDGRRFRRSVLPSVDPAMFAGTATATPPVGPSSLQAVAPVS
jgi:hypothetical protein